MPIMLEDVLFEASARAARIHRGDAVAGSLGALSDAQLLAKLRDDWPVDRLRKELEALRQVSSRCVVSKAWAEFIARALAEEAV